MSNICIIFLMIIQTGIYVYFEVHKEGREEKLKEKK